MFQHFLKRSIRPLFYVPPKPVGRWNIHKQNESYNDLNVTISKMKPPVFWKDRPVYLKMLKKWDKQSVIEVLKYLAKVENKIKKNSSINSLTIIKNSITNICTNSWTYF